MLQQQSHSVISSKLNLLRQPVVFRNPHQENYPGIEHSPTLINEINPENLKVLKDGGPAFILSLCLLTMVLKDLIEALHRD